MTKDTEALNRPYPQLLDQFEAKALMAKAENLWSDLQANNLGGFSGINRPFYILHEFRSVIEEFGNRDVGLSWSKDQLDAAKAPAPDTIGSHFRNGGGLDPAAGDDHRDLFDAGFAACWSEMFVVSKEKPAFALNDSVFDRAWEIYLATRGTHPAPVDPVSKPVAPIHDDDCEAMLRPRADCTCRPISVDPVAGGEARLSRVEPVARAGIVARNAWDAIRPVGGKFWRELPDDMQTLAICSARDGYELGRDNALAALKGPAA